MTSFLLVMTGCALGGASRYGLMLVLRSFGDLFPYATLTANLLGCFAIGVISALLVDVRDDLAEALRLFFMVGFLGGLSTLSAFSVETIDLLEAGHVLTACTNILTNILGGIAVAYLGIRLVRYFL